ncbi:zinc finger ccch domain-containing protein zfn-like [Quercus suber]|uniref:Zinc finger ccch domain-containing protein zfn-like n=1 Tax=Quercus suber TaxID=58331 RepID=A0AAW0J3Y6_QUESU
MVSLNFSPAYPTDQSPTTPGQQSYPGGITDWSRASFIPSPRWRGPSSLVQYVSFIILERGQFLLQTVSRIPRIFLRRERMFGADCRFHHPRERLIPASETASSEKHDDPEEPKRLVSKL